MAAFGVAVAVVLFLNLLDVLVATLFLLKSNWTTKSWQNATADLNFCTCTIDLWFIAISRFALMIGAIFGLRANPVQGYARLRLSRRPIFCLAFGIIVFVLVKFLASTECVQEHSSKVWLWLFFGHTCMFSFILSGSWWVLSKGSSRQPSLVVNADQEVGSVLEQERSSLQSDSDNESVNSDDSSDDSESKSSKSKVTISRLLAVSKPDTHYLLLAFLFLLCASVGEMFIPYYTGQVIDSIAIEKDSAKFHRAIIIMALLSFMTAVCSGLRGGIFTLVLSRFYIRVNKLLFGSIVSQEIAFFDKTRTGDIVSRLTSDTSKMGEQVTLNINVFLRNLVTALGVCVLMFHISWKLSILTLISIPVVAVISEIYGKYFQELSEKVQNSIAKANEVAEEVISAMRTVRSFANEDGAAREYAEKLDKTYSLNKKEALVYGGYTWCNHVLEMITDVLTLYYGGHLVMKGQLSGGDLVSFLLYSLSLGQAIEEIGDVYTGLVDAVGAAGKVFQYIDRKPQIPNDGTLAPSEFSGRVEFKNVSFSYPTRSDSNVLKNISFVVEPGEMVALVGSSGAGKSTCINLLQHFYEPNEGDVLIDGISVKELDHKFLHRKVALVGQEPVLFARNLKENIAYNFGSGCASGTELDGLVTDAAKLSNAHDFITELANGYNTQAGEKGQQLSGGQKQRVAIARALIRKPSVVLFDEATSALDAESEYKIQEAMFRNLGGRTVIVVAHRFSTIEKANRIIVMDKGRIVEVGNHAELMANGRTYAKLVRHQLVKTEGLKEDDSSMADDSLKQDESLKDGGSFREDNSLKGDKILNVDDSSREDGSSREDDSSREDGSSMADDSSDGESD